MPIQNRPSKKQFREMVVVDDNGCWIWQGTKSSRGYGLLIVDKKQVRAHRYAWKLFKKKSEEGLCVCHTCDTPSCVNPKHLFLGTHKDNAEDRERKGRHGIGNGFPKGSHHTSETREKMSISHTGLQRSVYHKARISEGQKRRWALRKELLCINDL